MATATALPKRQDVPKENTWNLESIYAQDEQWEADFARCEARLPQLASLAGTLAGSPQALLHAIEQINKAEMLLSQVIVYAMMRRDEDTTNSHYQGLADRAQMLAARFGSTTAFFAPELLAISDEQIEEFLVAHEPLQLYRHFLSELRRQRAHIRSAEVEAVLAQATEVTHAADTIFGMINNADLKFPTIRDEEGNEVELTKGRFILFLESKDRRVRHDAFETLYRTYARQRNTLGATLSFSIKRDVFEARVHDYESSLAAALEPDAIPLDVYHNLIDTVNRNLHHMHRYLKIRKRLLGLDDLHFYDLYVPLAPGATVEVDYDEARRTVLEALSPLGSEYTGTVRGGLYEQRWVDIYENQGKQSGAYSSGTYTTQPFVLLNYQHTLDNVFTLAHELGHSMHSYLTRRAQPYVYGSYTIFVAEVASTLNEALLAEHLLKTTEDRNVKLQIVNQQIETFRATLFRQCMFAEFELETHRRAEAGEALNADKFSEIYRGLLERYFASEVVLDDEILLEWCRIPHFYRAFYVFKYATGISAATALAQKILHEGQPAVDRYLEFLNGGSSKTSIDLLRGAGVDMATPEPIELAMGVFGRLVDQLDELTREMGNGSAH